MGDTCFSKILKAYQTVNVYKLMRELTKLSDAEKEMPIFVHDGMDPSDPAEANCVEVRCDRGREWTVQIKT